MTHDFSNEKKNGKILNREFTSTFNVQVLETKIAVQMNQFSVKNIKIVERSKGHTEVFSELEIKNYGICEL